MHRSDAERALPIVERLFGEFELASNPYKVSIEQLPAELDIRWRQQIQSYRLEKTLSEAHLFAYFDLLFELHRSNVNEHVLRYGIGRLRSCLFEDEGALQKLLFQCILVEPGTLKAAMILMDMKKIAINLPFLGTILRHLLLDHGAMRHGSEIAWALWTAIYYKIPIDDEAISALKNFEDSVVALLTLHARQEGIVSGIVDDFWRHLMTKSSFKEGHWLLAYEARFHNWLDSKDADDHAKSEQNFLHLSDLGVSFYNTNMNTYSDSSEFGDHYDFILAPAEDDELSPSTHGLPF